MNNRNPRHVPCGCLADMPWNEARNGVLTDVQSDDESSWWEILYNPTLKSAKLRTLNQTGDDLAQEVIGRCANGRGVVFLESNQTASSPVEIVVKCGDAVILTYRPKIRFSDIDSMYRWHNIRGGSAPGEVASPTGWPDSERDDANLFFVHGYNVSEQEAREWGRAFFKRMWWSGMNAKFHVVTWYGNDSQRYIPEVGLVTPDYHVNVEHALASSTNLVAVAERYAGRKFFIAHSLGNMLVSSAIQDWSLPHDKYMLLNAAVAAEAYDPTAITIDNAKARLTCPEWIGMDDSRRATHWFEHPGFAANDARRTLTWKNRFADVTKVINYYSSEEEVLCCGQGEDIDPLQREYAWYNQERLKGNMIPGSGRNEGGWGFNSKYMVPGGEFIGQPAIYVEKWLPPTAYAVSQITDDARTSPVFRPFEDGTLHTTNLVASISREMWSQLLADAIPAESLPVGSSVVPKWSVSLDIQGGEGGPKVMQNKNMALEFKDSVNKNVMGNESKQAWGHSFFLSAPYMVVHGLFEDLKSNLGGDQ